LIFGFTLDGLNLFLFGSIFSPTFSNNSLAPKNCSIRMPSNTTRGEGKNAKPNNIILKGWVIFSAQKIKGVIYYIVCYKHELKTVLK